MPPGFREEVQAETCGTGSPVALCRKSGNAFRVDRMVMLIAGEDSIREIIPFPMNKNAQDVMMGAPAEVDEKQLREVHIKISAPEKQ